MSEIIRYEGSGKMERDPEGFFVRYSDYADLERQIAELRAHKARLSEALTGSIVAIDDWLHTFAPEECKPEHVEETKRRLQAGGTLWYIAVVQEKSRAALSSAPATADGWRFVPYLWQCKDYADGWLSYANEDEAQAYQRDTGCAVRITYRPIPAAPTATGGR